MLKIISIKTGWNIPAEKGNKTRQTHMLVDPSLTHPCLLEHALQGTGEFWLPSSIPHCSAQCRARTASSTGALPGARKFRFEEKLVCCASLAYVRTAWEQGWCVGFRTLHNGYSELLKVGLSQFNSHLQRAVISAPLPEHRGPFDKSLCTGTAALFPHERNIFNFFH